MSDKKNKKALVPERRFPAFRGAESWKLESFDDLYSFKSTNSLSRDKLNYKSGSIKNIHYGDIHTKFSTLFDIEQEEVPFINTDAEPENIQPDSYCVEGDLIFADASEDVDDIGKSIEVINLGGQKVLSGLHTLLARQKDKKLVIGFGGHLFKSSEIRAQIQKESQGTKVLGVSAGRLSDISLHYPQDKQEQQKIADCLSSLDGIVAAQAKKVEALKDHKKALMQSLFPREGRSAPELRFPEFKKGAGWEKTKLSELLFETKHRNRNLKYTAKDVLSVSGEYGCVNQIEFMGRSYAGKSVKDYHVVEKGDIVYTKSPLKKNPYGIIKENRGKAGIVSTLYAVYRTTEKGHSGYLDRYFSLDDSLNAYLQPIVRKGAKNDMKVNNAAVLGGEIWVPKRVEEQHRISDFLSAVDGVISIHEQKLRILKDHKKGLMQQLFPAQETAEER